MNEQEPTPDNQYISVPCSNCGSEMVYDPKSQGLLCHHCGHTADLPKASNRIIERSMSEAFSLSNQPTGFAVETKLFHCNNCGAETAVDPDVVHFECPFCNSKNVNESAFDQKMIRPAGVLPFKITKESAMDAFTSWIGKGFFRPSKLAKAARAEGIHGVYLPFWTYDAHTASNWRAEAGHHYYETESYTDGDGNPQTRQVQKTRWVSASGYYEQDFDDVLIIASHGLKQKDVDKITPFEFDELVNYDSRFILGLESEVYQKDVHEGYKDADKVMDAEIRSQIVRRIPGDTHRNLRVNTRKDNITFKHILLPIWVSAYQFKGKTFRFMVNGQTGKISGKKPTSWGKVIAAIAIGAGLIGGLIWFLTR